MVSQYSVRPHVVEPQRGTGAHDAEPFSVKPGLQAPQAATLPDWLHTRFWPSHIVVARPPGPAQVGSFAQLADTHATQVLVIESNLKLGSHMPTTQTASWPLVIEHSWLGAQPMPPSIGVRSCAQVTGSRHCIVAMLQTRPPRHVEVELQAQPFTSGLHVWHRLDMSQYALLSQTGPWVRQGQPGAPGVHVSGAHVPLLQVRPALHVVPLQAQPF